MTPGTLIIRPETSDDILEIRRINEIAFGGMAEADLVDALRDAGKIVVSLVAMTGSVMVGHILFSRVAIESSGDAIRAVGLAPMSVKPEWQNQGIGSQLVKAGLGECTKLGFECVIVLGHSHYYPRFGFVPASRFGIRSEYAVDDDVFMALELQPATLARASGVAKYEPEFSLFT